MRKNLKVERVRCGLTQKQAAKYIGVSANTYSRWECGAVEPKASALMKLSQFYGCTPEYLLGMTDERTASAIA